MQTIAMVRPVSPTLGACELTFLDRTPIDVECAVEQHAAYERCLADLGAEVMSIGPAPAHPDAVFIEDTALVLDEMAIVMRSGAPSRWGEVRSVAQVLSQFRRLEHIEAPGTVDGGDIVHAGGRLLVGLSRRTNIEGAEQVRDRVREFGYEVRFVPVHGAAHLKSACSTVGQNTLLVNPTWIDAEALESFQLLAVPPEEPWAANTVMVCGTIVSASGFPRTRDLLERANRQVVDVDIGEFQKAEGGVSCLSLIFADCDDASR